MQRIGHITALIYDIGSTASDAELGATLSLLSDIDTALADVRASLSYRLDNSEVVDDWIAQIIADLGRGGGQ
jgi:hypothetical protein